MTHDPFLSVTQNYWFLLVITLIIVAFILATKATIYSKKINLESSYKEAQDCCNEANNGNERALAYIKQSLEDKESPDHYLFNLIQTSNGSYFASLTEEAEYVSGRAPLTSQNSNKTSAST